MKPSEILRAAKPLLGTLAKGTAWRGGATVFDPRCTARCIRGAIWAAAGSVHADEVEKYAERACRMLGMQPIDDMWLTPRFNDWPKVDVRHARGLLDWAAQLAEDAGE